MTGLKDLLNKNFDYRTVLLFFVALALLTWLDVFAFFRGDDWSFIIDFTNGKSFTDYALIAHGGHVIPLFQAVYSLELTLFGKNAICMQFLSVLFWALTGFIFYLILNRFPSNEYKRYNSILIAAVFCLHPNFSDIIFWIFQQGVILHMLLQVLAVLYYFKYMQENTSRNFGLFLLFLFLQNYFFGNGILFPLLFMGHYLLEKKKFDKFILILFIIQLSFIFIQKALSLQEINHATLLENYSAIIISFFKLIYTSVVRFIFVKQVGGNILLYAALAIFAVICVAAFRNDRKHFYFAFLYMIISSLSIPLARFQISDFQPHQIHYYYSVLLFPSLFLLLYISILQLQWKKLKMVYTVLFLYACGFYLINIQAKRIYGYKHFKNKEAIQNAMLYSKKNYYAFEDAITTSGKEVYQSFILNPEIQKSIQKTDYFAADSSIIQYLGNKRYENFITYNGNILKSYKALVAKSFFNLDINYETK